LLKTGGRFHAVDTHTQRRGNVNYCPVETHLVLSVVFTRLFLPKNWTVSIRYRVEMSESPVRNVYPMAGGGSVTQKFPDFQNHRENQKSRQGVGNSFFS